MVFVHDLKFLIFVRGMIIFRGEMRKGKWKAKALVGKFNDFLMTQKMQFFSKKNTFLIVCENVTKI